MIRALREQKKYQDRAIEQLGDSYYNYEKVVKKALKLYSERDSNGLSVNDIAKMTGVPRSTIYAKAKEITVL